LNKIKSCKNNCIFCFIAQLPGNLRPTLYIKDDDYIESFSHGNFITLTNVSKKDIENIIKFKIEPLHISVHSFNSEIRNTLFGNTKTACAIDNLFTLDKNNIRTNIQIVLCPGINDAQDLENTLNILTGSFKKIQSIGIVPVGITKYNINPLLKPFDRNSCAKLINYIHKYRQDIKNPSAKKVYLSDEFYLIAGYDFPADKEYGRFLQIQNGIGKSADFLNDFKMKISSIERKHCIKINPSDSELIKISKNASLIITSEYGAVVLEQCMDFLKIVLKKYCLKYQNRIKLQPVKNIFFGGNVKVTGLLAGKDILDVLYSSDLSKYQSILVPEIIFNHDGLTLDDININVFKNLNPQIRIVKDNGKDLIKNLAGQNI
jgi:putative radical SAM enzyme (TIGR03279 family)